MEFPLPKRKERVGEKRKERQSVREGKVVGKKIREDF
jgi:hypothetical protein